MLNKIKDFKVVIGYGILWGIIELTLGNYLHLIHSPLKGYILGTIGCSIVGLYITKHDNIFKSVFIGVIAANFKPINMIIYKVPFLNQSIISPMISIIIEAIAISLFITYTKKYLKFNIFNYKY